MWLPADRFVQVMSANPECRLLVTEFVDAVLGVHIVSSMLDRLPSRAVQVQPCSVGRAS